MTGVGWRRTIAAVAALAIVAAFAANVRRWWFLNDDAFITFRYARNLVDGHGLVFNPGERVEGYTEFLFTLLMAGGIALHAPPEILSNVLVVAAGAAILAVVAQAGARRFGWTSPFTWLAPALLALHRVFTAWSSSGMAMQLFALFVLLGFLRFVRERDDARLAPAGSALWLALAALTRPEGVLAAAMAGAFLAADVLRRTRTARALVAWALPLLLIVGGHFAWRRWYYGFWLPNTFYAKVPGFYGEQGLLYLRLFFRDFPLHWFAPLLLLLFRRPRRFEHELFATFACAWLAWLFWIGGDWHEFRFFCPILPLLALLFAEAIARLAELGAARATRVASRFAGAAAAAALLATTHLGSHRTEAQILRDHVDSVDRLAAFTRRRTNDALRLRRLLDAGLLPRDLRIATGAAGILPWYTGLYTVDVLGLNEVEVAHAPLAARGIIGHERFAPRELLVRRKVALFDSAPALFWREAVEQLPRRSPNPVDLGTPLRCLRAGDRFLLFSTTLSDAEFAATFGKLERVF